MQRCKLYIQQVDISDCVLVRGSCNHDTYGWIGLKKRAVETKSERMSSQNIFRQTICQCIPLVKKVLSDH